MQLDLPITPSDRRIISPFLELGAYEALWDNAKTSFKSIAGLFSARPGAVPSDFVKTSVAERYADAVCNKFRTAKLQTFGVRIHGAAEYPSKLRDAKYPVELLYYQGSWDLVFSRMIAVVGTRNPTSEGRAKAAEIVESLVGDDFTIASGLAAGIDTAAHRAAIDCGGRTIAVIGTPLSHFYPRENEELQKKIGSSFLVISQVPLHRYERQDYRYNRLFFPERNATMSAISEATVIVEAGETSGTLIQARAALNQKRKVFILDTCFDKGLSWPKKFEKAGAIRVKRYDDIRRALSG